MKYTNSTIKETIENKRDKIKDIYFETLANSYNVNYYVKCYIDNNTKEILTFDCVSSSEIPAGDYDGDYTHLFTIGPNEWYLEDVTDTDDISYCTSKEGLEDNDDEVDMFDYLFDELIKNL